MGDAYKSFNSEDEVNEFFDFISEDMSVAFASLEEYEWLFMDNIKALEKIQKQQEEMKFYWNSFKSAVIPCNGRGRSGYDEVAILFGDGHNMYISYLTKREYIEDFQEWASRWDVDLLIEDGNAEDGVFISCTYDF